MNAQRRRADDQQEPQVARARWGNKMIEFIGADSQHLVIILMIVIGVSLIVWDNRERHNMSARQASENAKLFLEAHIVTQSLLKETLVVLKKGNEEQMRQGINMTYVLSLSAEERKALRLDVPADFRAYYGGRR